MKYFLIVFLFFCPAWATAGINFVASAETGHFVRNQSQTDGTSHANGDMPFIGKVGLEYDVQPKITLFTHYTHRSNIDLTQREYWYDSINFGVRFARCFYKCSAPQKVK